MEFFANFVRNNGIVECNNTLHYKQLRQLLRIYGIEKFYKELEEFGWFKNGEITSDKNPFARILTRKSIPTYGDLLKQKGIESTEFFIARNLPDCDKNWNNSDPLWVGKASMSKH